MRCNIRCTNTDKQTRSTHMLMKQQFEVRQREHRWRTKSCLEIMQWRVDFDSCSVYQKHCKHKSVPVFAESMNFSVEEQMVQKRLPDHVFQVRSTRTILFSSKTYSCCMFTGLRVCVCVSV
jgi:hypothetical protein